MQRPDEAPTYERRYVLFFALFCGLLSILPNLYALIAAPPGASYLGFQWATDDQMVYAAWMRQAMDGQFFFDNRFTTDPQPALTIHVYFFVLGLIAKVTGIAFALALSKFVFSVLFVFLMHRFLRRLTQDTFVIKLALTFVVFGAGLGFLVWHKFGEDILPQKANFLSGLLMGKLPNDVWQPEAYVFPSMLTTGLFMVSLCLILIIFTCFLDARQSWKPVLPGALAMLVLMNIHSYDVLLIALVMVAFLGASVAARQVTGVWIARALAIGAGAIPSALWFMYVLRNDPVFQARADTPTFAPTFRQLFFGYVLLMVLGIVWLIFRDRARTDLPQWRRLAPAAIGAVVLILFALAGQHEPASYWMGMPSWIAAFAAAITIVLVAARSDLTQNLVVAWAIVGLVAPYFPGLFQRKLLMGLSVPWAILAAFGFAMLLKQMERGQRNLVAILGIVLVCGTSGLWLLRDFSYVRDRVSRTIRHPVYLSEDVEKAIDYLDKNRSGRTVVLALPGGLQPKLDAEGNPMPDEFVEPLLPLQDLNPIISGLTGAYTYIGHWSETPNYYDKIPEVTRAFIAATDETERDALITKSGATHVLAPVPAAFVELNFYDWSQRGQVLVASGRLQLVALRR